MKIWYDKGVEKVLNVEAFADFVQKSYSELSRLDYYYPFVADVPTIAICYDFYGSQVMQEVYQGKKMDSTIEWVDFYYLYEQNTIIVNLRNILGFSNPENKIEAFRESLIHDTFSMLFVIITARNNKFRKSLSIGNYLDDSVVSRKLKRFMKQESNLQLCNNIVKKDIKDNIFQKYCMYNAERW